MASPPDDAALQHEQRVRAANAAREVPFDPTDYDLGEDEDIRLYEHHRLVVDPGQELMRLDLFLGERLKAVSRSRLKSAALAGFIRVNEKPQKVSYKVKPQDEITVILPYPPENTLDPEPLDLDIRYEDDDLLIVNKPAGLVVHPGAGNFNGTLVNGLLWHFRHNLDLPEVQRNSMRPGLVHRIDKDTSGLLVVAKHEESYNFLSQQFFDRTTRRRYYALVWGDVQQDAGTIVGNIGRSPRDRKHYMVFENGEEGRHAVTHYEVIQRFGVCTLVRCKLETGRTHQIRVHMKYLGHTLFNDSFYGGHKILRGKPSRAFQRFMHHCMQLLPRQALHARTLGFQHPGTQQEVDFDAELPEDFRLCLLRMARFFSLDPLPELEPYAEASGFWE